MKEDRRPEYLRSRENTENINYADQLNQKKNLFKFRSLGSRDQDSNNTSLGSRDQDLNNTNLGSRDQDLNKDYQSMIQGSRFKQGLPVYDPGIKI